MSIYTQVVFCLVEIFLLVRSSPEGAMAMTDLLRPLGEAQRKLLEIYCKRALQEGQQSVGQQDQGHAQPMHMMLQG